MPSLAAIVSFASAAALFALGLYFLHVESSSRSPTLYRQALKDADKKDAVCNDGTAPLYYINLNPDSTEWLFYLQGGGDCYNKASCADRAAIASDLMTGSLNVNPET